MDAYEKEANMRNIEKQGYWRALQGYKNRYTYNPDDEVT